MAAELGKRKFTGESCKWRIKIILKTRSMKKRKTTINRYVPPELVREIFINLPSKSLCRFRAICKGYHSLIDDVHFMEERRKRLMKATHLLTWDTTNLSNLHLFNMGVDGYTYIKTIPTYKYEHMLPSSYNMVCLHGHDNKNIALFNPSSGEIRPLPDLPEPFSFETINQPFAPQPTTRRYNFLGFGFDPDSRRYKIVQMIVRNSNILRFHILSVISNGSSWRTVNMSNDNKSSLTLFRYQPICVGGVLYWELWITVEGGHIDVLLFDLSTEEMKIVQSPAKWRGDIYGNGGHLAMLEGNLCCYEMPSSTYTLSLTMNIWKLEYDSNNNVNWNLQYKLEIYGLNSEVSPLIPLYLCNKRIIFQDHLLKVLYYYDIGDKNLKMYPMTEKVEGCADTLRLMVHSITVRDPVDYREWYLLESPFGVCEYDYRESNPL